MFNLFVALLIVSLQGLMCSVLTCTGHYTSKKQDRILNTVITMYFMHEGEVIQQFEVIKNVSRLFWIGFPKAC